MAKPKVFISSTCYDLGVVRSELRLFITGFGFEPIMSDHSDILYDPKHHTHDSCISEISSSDLLVLLIGSRLGGRALPSAKALVALENAEGDSSESKIAKIKDRLSITQLETLRAIELGVPIYAFVQNDVLRDHHLYEKNKSKLDIIGEIDFPSIERRDTAEYIFEFINYIRSRANNNSIFEFSNVEDVRNCLRSQWAQLFQRLLSERVLQQKTQQEFRSVTAQIEDLKAAILTSIGNDKLKDTAKGVIKYRRLMDFMIGLLGHARRDAILSDLSWSGIIELAQIESARMFSFDDSSRPELVLERPNDTFFRFRGSDRMYQRIIADWESYKSLGDEARSAVYDALVEAYDTRPNVLLRQYDMSLEDYTESRGRMGPQGTVYEKESGRSLGDILGEALKRTDADE
jgi:hypothetical protein